MWIWHFEKWQDFAAFTTLWSETPQCQVFLVNHGPWNAYEYVIFTSWLSLWSHFYRFGHHPSWQKFNFCSNPRIKRRMVWGNLETDFLPLVEHLSFVKFSHILSSWLHAQSNCLSTLQAQNPRLPDWDWDSLRQRFFSSLTDTLEMRKPHSASQHCCWTDQHLQAGGVSLIRFLQKAVSLKSLSFSLSWRLYSACSREKS